jgi:hypothetical protein
MKTTTREQIDYLKEKIKEGYTSKKLRADFRRRFKLSVGTYDCRVVRARAEIKAERYATALETFHTLYYRQGIGFS